MPEYLSPGVYVEEFEIGARPIEGMSTSTAGFLGITERGPEQPTLITGMEQFKRLFGGYVENVYLTYGVDGFFRNGGKRCFVGRIASRDAKTARATYGSMTISAIGPGTWGDNIAFKIEAGALSTGSNPRIKLTVMYWTRKPATLVDPTLLKNLMDPNRREPDLIETFDNLTADPGSIDCFDRRINGQSSLIAVLRNGTDLPGTFDLGFISDLGAGGDNGSEIDLEDYKGRTFSPGLDPEDNTVVRTGFKGFEEIDEIAIVCVPDHQRIGIDLTQEIVTHCTLMGDRFAILNSNPSTDTIQNAGNIITPMDTTYAAFYFPWIKTYDPRTNSDILVPPSGHVAGIYAKTDIERGVFKAPANEVVDGATDLQFQITKGEQDVLNPRGVNCIRSFPGKNIRVWGARTCSTNTLWKYVNVRRLFLYLEDSIYHGTQWVVFEPNNEKLWGRVTATVSQFLTTVWRDGGLMGTKVEDAFFVKCDRTTMTPDDLDNGRLICVIGVAPVKPAEFVIFRITQWPGGSAVTE